MQTGWAARRSGTAGVKRASIGYVVGIGLFVALIPSCSSAAAPAPSPSTPNSAGGVPDVVAETQAAAQKDLKDAGFEVVVVFQRTGPPNPPPLGTVISERPAAGALVPPGSKVTITVYQELAPG